MVVSLYLVINIQSIFAFQYNKPDTREIVERDPILKASSSPIARPIPIGVLMQNIAKLIIMPLRMNLV